jgi:hypothetical protein
MSFHFPLAAATLLLSLALPAQLQTRLTGTIQKVAGTPCNAKATHRVACTELLLYSSLVDLTQLEGRQQTIEGTLRLSPGCTTIEVTAAEAPAQRTTALALFGFRIGRPVTFTTFAPAGSLVAYFFGTGPGFAPLGQFGSLLLDPVGIVYWASDLSIGIALRTATIPNDPQLVGVDIWMQTAWLQLAPTLGGGMLNPTCFTIAR